MIAINKQAERVRNAKAERASHLIVVNEVEILKKMKNVYQQKYH